MRVDAECQFAQAAQERRMLEEKLAQVERNTQLSLNNKEKLHREQIEAERRQKVQRDSRGYVGSTKFKSDASAIELNQRCMCLVDRSSSVQS